MSEIAEPDLPELPDPSPRRVRCIATTKAGTPCKLWASQGRPVCRYHDPDPAAVARIIEEGRRGGYSATAHLHGPTLEPLADEIDLSSIDLATAEGVREYGAAALRGLARMPFSPKVAAVMAQLANTQRANIDSADVEARLVALEQAQHGGPRLVQDGPAGA